MGIHSCISTKCTAVGAGGIKEMSFMTQIGSLLGGEIMIGN